VFYLKTKTKLTTSPSLHKPFAPLSQFQLELGQALAHWEMGNRKPLGPARTLLAFWGAGAQEIFQAEHTYFESVKADRPFGISDSESRFCLILDIPIRDLVIKKIKQKLAIKNSVRRNHVSKKI
jgi:hypothetical protein